MIIQKDFLNKLKDFGLNSYESKLWAALLSRGMSTAGELSDIANVPRSRTYDVLESLEKKSFIIMKIGKPIKYLAVPPTEVIERVKKKVQEEANQQMNIIESIKDSEILQELNLLHKQGIEIVEPSDHSGIIKGRPNIYNHMESMIKNAKKSIFIQTSAEGLSRKHEALYKSLEKASKKGIDVTIKAPLNKKNEKHKTLFSQIATVADSKNLSRVCVVDSKELLFMLMDDASVHPNFDVGVWVNTPTFAQDIENSVFK